MEDWEYSEFFCPICGEMLKTRDCECDEGFIDLYEEDPLYFDPGDEKKCPECHGVGSFFWCGSNGCDVTNEEIEKALKDQHEEFIQ